MERYEESTKRQQSSPLHVSSGLFGKYSLIDIGLNLAASQFDKDRDDVIRRAREVGVERMIVTGEFSPSLGHFFSLLTREFVEEVLVKAVKPH
jgi:Tat protein secretion system quality control protein TatD with DNase activity